MAKFQIKEGDCAKKKEVISSWAWGKISYKLRNLAFNLNIFIKNFKKNTQPL